jgi:replicative DNA helicase
MSLPEENVVTLPASQHSEQTILGACLVEPVALVDASALLKPDDFALDSHRRIFAAFLALGDGAVDIVTVADYLRKHKQLDSVGGLPYLASLSEGLPRKLSIESYVRIVHDAARRREIYRLTDSIGQGALANEDEAVTLIQQAKRWLAEIEDETGTDAPMESVGDYLAAHYEDEERVFDLNPREQGVPSGFAWQDDKTGGFLPSKFYVIAARTSMGKTAHVISTVCNIALKSKIPLALFTLEQDKPELLDRLLCVRATASLTDRIWRRSDAGDKEAIRRAYRDYQAAPLYWDDTRSLTVSQIRAKLIRLNKSLPEGGKLKVAFIDQLSFLSWADVYEKGVRPDQLIGRMCKALKNLAKELGIAIVLVAQVNRGATKNKDAKPTLTDLKDSGDIEEAADVVAFLHRAEYYDKSDESLKGKGEYIIAKQRQGPVGSHTMSYLATSCKWIDKWEPKDGDDDGSQIPW